MRLIENSISIYIFNKKGYQGFKWLYRIRKSDNKITNLILFKEENKTIAIYSYNCADYGGNWPQTSLLLKYLVEGKEIVEGDLYKLPQLLSKAIKEMGMKKGSI